jgi:TonB family protein
MLFAILIAVTLAAPTSGARVPGTRLRLGMSEKQLQSVGEFAEAQAPGARTGAEARKGTLKFFGVPCEATLYFQHGLLARARFEADDVSPHAIDYVEDQLRRARMWRECSRYEATEKICDWMGESKLHLEIKAGHLDARAEPAPNAEVAEESPPANPVVAGAGGAGAGGAGATAPSATPAVTDPGPAHTEPPAPAPAVAMAPARGPADVPTLPETLTITLVTKNSPSDWPRIVSSPPLEYPDAARRESVQGVVWVLALVGPDGAVQSAAIDRGIPELNAAALSWIQHARFAPCMRDDHACRFWVSVAVRFTLY